MIQVTELAKQLLKRMLEDCTDDLKLGFRLQFSGGDEFQMFLDSKVSGDQVVEYDGSIVLLVGEKLSLRPDAIVDVKNTARGMEITVELT